VFSFLYKLHLLQGKKNYILQDASHITAEENSRKIHIELNIKLKKITELSISVYVVYRNNARFVTAVLIQTRHIVRMS